MMLSTSRNRQSREKLAQSSPHLKMENSRMRDTCRFPSRCIPHVAHLCLGARCTERGEPHALPSGEHVLLTLDLHKPGSWSRHGGFVWPRPQEEVWEASGVVILAQQTQRSCQCNTPDGTCHSSDCAWFVALGARPQRSTAHALAASHLLGWIVLNEHAFGTSVPVPAHPTNPCVM